MGALHTLSCRRRRADVRAGTARRSPTRTSRSRSTPRWTCSRRGSTRGCRARDRLAKALSEQQGFLNGFFDPALKAALDLRIVVDPQAATPVSVALLGRVWGADTPRSTARAERLCTQVHASLPRHVAGYPGAG